MKPQFSPVVSGLLAVMLLVLAGCATPPPPAQESAKPALPDITLMVLAKEGNRLDFIRPDGTKLAEVPVGQHPHEMKLSPDRKLLFTTDNGTMRIEQTGKGGNKVSIIDLATRSKAGEVDLGNYYRPHGIDYDAASGMLAVSTENPDRLLIIDPVKRKVVKTYATKGKTSHMVSFGPQGKWAYVSNSSSGNVAAIRLSDGAVTLIPTGQRPEGSVLSQDGRYLFVCNRESATVSVIDTEKNEKVRDIAVARGPVRIALTPDGRAVVIAAMHDRKVQAIDAGTMEIIADIPLDGRLVSLNLSQDGERAFASDEEANKVFVVSLKEKKLLQTIPLAPGTGPDPVLEVPQS